MLTTGRRSLDPAQDTPFEAGLRALAAADWQRACELLRAALGEHSHQPEGWEALAEAAWWVPDEPTFFEARERAYQLYRQRGDKADAARMAAWLAMDSFEMRGQPAVANGWMQKAQRLIAGHKATPANAWVTLLNARLIFLLGEDPAAARRMASRAAGLARRAELTDIEALAMSLEGLMRLGTGDVAGGVRCLDEASATVIAGEVTNLTAAGLTLCQLMYACERTGDFDRARQWCAAAKQFSEDRGFPVIMSICRPHYAAVLMWRGHWPEAEEHLQIGSRELTEFGPPFAVGALAMLARLRWRQGRWDEAEQIFEQVRHETPAQIGLAELSATKGDIPAAIDLLERFLRAVSPADKLERGPALELLVRSLAAAGKLERARECMAELRSIADSVRTPSLRAAAAFAEGMLAGAAANWELAQQSLGDAVELFERAGAPFESARARIALAESLSARGRLDTAARETLIAEETLERIGAAKEAARAAELLAAINARRTAAAPSSPDGLTPREAEILTLLAQGRSNQEIAASLVLSIRTVERHISNIYQKLGLEGRTARTAAAVHAHRWTTRAASVHR
jgi:ATP/maltotriose-dependent transcriptional regulator MalT